MKSPSEMSDDELTTACATEVMKWPPRDYHRDSEFWLLLHSGSQAWQVFDAATEKFTEATIRASCESRRPNGKWHVMIVSFNLPQFILVSGTHANRNRALCECALSAVRDLESRKSKQDVGDGN